LKKEVWCTVHFPHLDIVGVRKWGKTTENGGTGYEAGTCFMAQVVSKKYQSQIHRLLEQFEISVACNVIDKCVCTDSSP
jgi:hypothetical protein